MEREVEGAQLPDPSALPEPSDRACQPAERCAICYEDCSEDDVWCRFGCGGNLHAACMERWLRVATDRGCPLCRAPWGSSPAGSDDRAQPGGEDSRGEGSAPSPSKEEGFLNLREMQPGTSAVRDESTWSRWLRL